MASWLRGKLQAWVDGSRPCGGASAHVTAFGKHPGWDDHIDDIPLPTDTLVEFQRLLYLQGIGQNIETGKWSHAPGAHVLPRFDHWIFWSRREREFVVARLWSSVDGKGRTSYPLVIAAQINDLPTPTRLTAALQTLEALEASARPALRAPDVRQAVIDAQDRLRAASDAPAAAAAPLPAAVADPLARLEARLTRDGLHRLMYESARGGAATWMTSDGFRSAVTLRAPPVGESIRDEMSLWIAFANRLLRPRPILILIAGTRAADDVVPATTDGRTADGRPATAWVDVICGASTAAELTCLRFTEAIRPPTTSIPYALDAGFRVGADAVVRRPAG